MKKLFSIALSFSMLLLACNSDKTKTETGDKKDNAMTSGESKEEKNKQVVMNCMDAFNNGDMDKAFADVAPDFMDYGDGSTPATPRDSLKAFFTTFKASVPDYKGANTQYVADGNTVVVLGDWSGTFKNDLMGMKATGKTFTFKDADVFTLNDDSKIISHRSMVNLGAVLMGSK